MAENGVEAVVEKVDVTIILQKIGETTRIVGSEAIAVNEDNIPRILEVGNPIYLHDTITTAADTFVTITLTDKTVFQLGPDSKATLNIYQYDSETKTGELDANLLSGWFRFISGAIAENQAGQHSILHTPAAKMGVRGSELDINISAQGDTTILHSLGFIDVVTHNQHSFSVFNPQTRVHIAIADDIAIETALLSEQQFGSLRAWTNPLASAYHWDDLQPNILTEQLSIESSIKAVAYAEPRLTAFYTFSDNDASSYSLPSKAINSLPNRLTASVISPVYFDEPIELIELVSELEPVAVKPDSIPEDNSALYVNYAPSQVFINNSPLDLNHAPQINFFNDNKIVFQIAEVQSLYLSESNLLAFATDEDKDPLLVNHLELLTTADSAAATLSQNTLGQVIVKPDKDLNGFIYLQYQVSDASIYIEWLNKTPVANDDVLYLIPIQSLLNNDTDADQDSLQLTELSSAINGEISYDANNNPLLEEPNTDILRGDQQDNLIEGQAGNNRLNTDTDNNQLFTGIGDDIIELNHSHYANYIDGSTDIDSLQLQNKEHSLDLVTNRLLPLQQLQLNNIEKIDLGDADNQIILKPADVLQFNDEHRLFIEGQTGSVISTDNAWQAQGQLEINEQTYNHYTWQSSSDINSDSAEIFIQNELSQFIF